MYNIIGIGVILLNQVYTCTRCNEIRFTCRYAVLYVKNYRAMRVRIRHVIIFLVITVPLIYSTYVHTVYACKNVIYIKGALLTFFTQL